MPRKAQATKGGAASAAYLAGQISILASQWEGTRERLLDIAATDPLVAYHCSALDAICGYDGNGKKASA